MSTSKVYLALAAVIVVLAAPRGKADSVDLCAVEKVDSVRLACFDRAVAARRVAAAQAQKAAMEKAAAQNSTPESAPPENGAPQKGARENAAPEVAYPYKPLQAGKVSRERPEPFVARVTGMREVAVNEFAFELENGQVWKQMESAAWMNVRPQELITITPGALGSYFLTTSQKQTVQVKRIR